MLLEIKLLLDRELDLHENVYLFKLLSTYRNYDIRKNSDSSTILVFYVQSKYLDEFVLVANKLPTNVFVTGDTLPF